VETVDAVRQSLGELPAALRSRLETDSGLSAYDADVLINQGREVVSYFQEVANAGGDAKAAANWVTQDVLRTLKETNSAIESFPLSSAALGELVHRVKSGDVPSPRAREVFQTMLAKRSGVDAALAELGIAAVDESELIELCRTLLAANPKTIADVKAGKTQAASALIGQAKKKNPNVDPNRVREICLKLIAESP
jgi:aspartyl-tRNA(Asn)/glutamyl-tRNA(Gln) amidotransferase subunit B